MKKALLSAFLIGTFGTYIFSNQQALFAQSLIASPVVTEPIPVPNEPHSGPEVIVVAPVPAKPLKVATKPKTPSIKPASKPAELAPSEPQSTPEPAPEPTTVPIPKGQYNDGVYTGTEADAVYGIIQVKAIISGGKLTDVQFLQYPNDRQTSLRISEQAIPYLKIEALQAQSAQVDIVSGASDTSVAFVESLSAALSQAKA